MSHVAPVSFKVQSTLAAFRGVVALTGTAETVKYPGSAADLPLGITQDTVLDTVGAIGVFTHGKAKLEFNDTVTSGKLVALNNAGQGVPHVDVTAGSFVIGTLIGPTVAATGTIATVLINPMFKSIP